jgi:DNA-binding beta-propeller fold protein YncE
MWSGVELSSDIREYDLLVTSSASAKGSIRDGVYRFDAASGRFEGAFGCGAEIRDPRGIRLSPDRSFVLVNNGDDRILKFEAASGKFLGSLSFRPGLDPGGGKFGWDGRYYVGSRSEKSIIAFDVAGDGEPSIFVPGTFAKFPRGLAASSSGALYVASGTHPVTGEGQNTILRFDRQGQLDESFKVNDPDLSPLDIEVGPNGNLLSASEVPFGDANAITTVREYDKSTGRLERVFDAGRRADGQPVSRLPRGITIGPDGALYSSGADNVVRYDLQTGRFDRVVVASPDISVQSIIFVPKISAPCN